ncbi:hypothetical protein F4860DRAFT_514241 [Xylaria cubensis]|nr:hypothetical protein F4860DRAFT_514241 [Xylaria cubensis]
MKTKLPLPHLLKPDPDENMMLQYQLTIQQITKQTYDRTQTLHVKAGGSKQVLKDFEEATKISQKNINTISDKLSGLLEGEEGEVAEFRQQINDALNKVKGYQQRVDAGKVNSEECPRATLILRVTSYKPPRHRRHRFLQLDPLGTIAAPVIMKNYVEIEELEIAIRALRDTIEQSNAKLQAALRVQADTISISEVMGADLLALNKLFTDQKTTIPPMLMEQLQLNQIMEQWNTLKDYGMFTLNLVLEAKHNN